MQAQHQPDKKQNDKDAKQHPRDAGGSARNASQSESPGNQRNDQKHKRPIQHKRYLPGPSCRLVFAVQEPRPSLLTWRLYSFEKKGRGSKKITGGDESSLLARGPPIIDAFAIEAPIAPDSECGNLSFSQQAIDRTGVDVQIFCYFRYGHNFFVALHLTTL